MMFGMLIGGIGGAIKNNSGSNISDACNSFNKEQQRFNDTKNAWKDVLNKDAINLQKAQSINNTLVLNSIKYKNATRIVHDVFRQQENITMVIIAVFIFSIIITFLLRYFNVYSNIWNLIVNK